jgi:hypothetical protein
VEFLKIDPKECPFHLALLGALVCLQALMSQAAAGRGLRENK